jgi:hypothetical protein
LKTLEKHTAAYCTIVSRDPYAKTQAPFICLAGNPRACFACGDANMACLSIARVLNFTADSRCCKENVMLVVYVFVHVKADDVEAFKTATIENARDSLHEPGVARFDIVQQQDDPKRFLLVEVYRTAPGPAQGDFPLSEMAGRGGRDDGRAAKKHQVCQRFPG